MNTKRLLSLLLSLAMLLMTCMPMPAFAEGEIVEEVAVEEIVEQQVEETEEPVVEETEEPVVEETEEPVIEETEEPVVEEPVVEPEFVAGYVAYDADTEIFEDERLTGEPVVLAEDGVVYAFEEADEDVYAVYYVVEADEIEIGYVEGEGEALTEEDVEDYIKDIEKDEEAVIAEIPGVEDGILVAVELVVEETEITEEEPAEESAPVEEEEEDLVIGASTDAIQITAQPENQKVAVNTNATFSVTASGSGLTYQWQHQTVTGTTWNNTSSTGSTTDTMTIRAQSYRDGYKYRCKITDGSGNVAYTDIAVLTLAVAPTIKKHPAAQIVAVNANAEFSVVAEGEGLIYQWQHQTATGTSWMNTSSTGSTTDTMTIKAQAYRDGYKYRCKVSNADGAVAYTNVALLTIADPATITSQPTDQTVAPNANAVFSVVAEGEDLVYQWQHMTPTGSTWLNTSSTGSTTDTMTIKASTYRNGYKYRCKITNAKGAIAYTKTVVLTIVEQVAPPTITAQPVAQTVAVNANAVFSVTAEGEGLTYQWQHQTVTGTSWNNTSSTGSTTDTMTIKASSYRNGYKYRCKITNSAGGVTYSEIAVLTISAEVAVPKIVTQPVNKFAETDANAVFSVVAEGEGLTYQWQHQTATGTSWMNTSATGSTTDTMTIKASSYRNGYKYRCMVTNAAGGVVYTNTAVLTIVESMNPLVIVAQPENQAVETNANAVFSVVATGDELTYQWQHQTATGSTWINTSSTGSTTDTMTIKAQSYRNGYKYRCQITDMYGEVAYTEIAVLTIGTMPSIATQPASVEVNVGETATFAVEASGDSELTYQWQVKLSAEDEEWLNIESGVNAAYEVVADEAMNGYVYRVVVTSAQGLSVTSDEATLTVNAAVTEIVEGDVTYTITGENTVEIKSYAGTEASVTIPETVQGYTVTAVGASAFEGNTTLTSIDLPDTIEVIGQRAFANCTSLTSMN